MCPGGGFNQIASDHEGRDFAAWFNNQGITYAVLNYRMPHGDVEVIREDIREAIRLIRRQSAEGGNSSTGCYGSFYRRLYRCYCRNSLYRNRPARLSSIALSRYQHDRRRLTHWPSRERMLGETISEGLKETLSLELHVTADTPPTFIVLAEG